MRRRDLLKGTAAAGFTALASGLLVPTPARAQSWTPASIADCVLWLRADLGVTSAGGDGTAVSAWADQSGAGNNYAQGTSGAQPTLHSATGLLNGQACIGFNGANWLHSAQSFNYRPFTLYVICRRTGANSAPQVCNALFSTDEPSNSGQSLGWQGAAGAAPNAFQLEWKNSTAFYGPTGNPLVPLDTPILLGASWLTPAAGSTGTGTGAGVMNNVRVMVPSFFTAPSVQALTSTAGSDIGAYDASTNFAVLADVAEIVAFSSDLAGADFDALMGYFQARYGLPGGMGAPWKAGIFMGDGYTPEVNEQLRLITSSDGEIFDEFLTTYTPPQYGVRDPSVTGPWSGKYWCAYTNSVETGGNSPTYGDSTYFGLCSSPNGHGWTHVADVDCSAISGVTATWGPKWYFDRFGWPHLLVTCTTQWPTDAGFTVYEVHPTNAAMTSWSVPVALTMDGSMPSNIIDFHPFWLNGTLYAVFKDETAKYGCIARSSGDWNGTWSEIESGNWASWGQYWEGFSASVVSGSHVRIYMDDYTDIYGGGMHYSDGTGGSTPGTMSWTTPAAIAWDTSLNPAIWTASRNGVFTNGPPSPRLPQTLAASGAGA